MSRYNNVKTLLDADLQELEDLLESELILEGLAEDIAFVITSLWALVPLASREELKERVLNDITRYQVQISFNAPEDDDAEE